MLMDSHTPVNVKKFRQCGSFIRSPYEGAKNKSHHHKHLKNIGNIDDSHVSVWRLIGVSEFLPARDVWG